MLIHPHGAIADMKVLQTIPFQFVPETGRQLRFWTGTLNYNAIFAVPAGVADPAFVALQQGDREVMLRSLESATSDMPSVTPFVDSPGMALYHKVDSLQGFDAEAEGLQLLLGPHETSYGALEFWVKDPSGYVHAFAEKITQ